MKAINSNAFFTTKIQNVYKKELDIYSLILILSCGLFHRVKVFSEIKESFYWFYTKPLQFTVVETVFHDWGCVELLLKKKKKSDFALNHISIKLKGCNCPLECHTLD